MTLNTRRLERLFYCLISALIMFALPMHATDPNRTVVADTLYRADGSTAKGTILISWPAFSTADGKPVAAGTLSVKIGSNGSVNIPLIPTQGASPTGIAYKVVISLDDGSSSTELWSVPNISPTTIAAIRSAQVPLSIAMQMVSREYVDQQLAGAMHKNGEETISGVKTFMSSPVVPVPGTDAAAANKAYVDLAVAAAAPSSGVLTITKGGTGANSFTPSRCVRVSSDGNSLESAASDCGGGAANADTLDGLHASAFLGATAKAADSDLLDGSHATDFANAVYRTINADRQLGADWCAKVNAADAALGSNPGQIILTSAAGNSTCSADVIINAGHTLRDMEGATYRLNTYSLKYDSRSAIIGTGRPQAPTVKQTMFFYTGTGSAIAPKTPTALTLAPVFRDFGVADKNAWDGGTATALVGLDLTNVGYCMVSNIAAYQFAKTGAAAFLRYTTGSVAGAYYCRFEHVYGTYNYDGMVWDNDATAKANFENYGTAPLRDTVIDSQLDISTHYAYDVRDQSSGTGGQTTLTFVSPKAESYNAVGMHLAARANTIEGAKIEDHHNTGQIALLLDGHGCDNYITGSYWADPIGNPATKIVDNNTCTGGAGGDTPGNTVETGSGFGGLKISGAFGLPRTTNWHLWLGSDDDASRLGRIYIGDGSGTKRVEFATRSNSVDTPVMGLKDSTEFFLYRPTTYTDEAHFEKARFYWNGNIFQIGTDAGSGGGVYRSVCLASGNSQTLCTNSSTIFFNRDNVVDIGTAGFKPRTIYAGTSVDTPKLTGITDSATVTNLNADLIDGKHSADFPAAGSCTNQVVTGINNGSAPTCSSVTATMLASAAYRMPIRGYCTGIAGTSQVISVDGLGATAISCSQTTAPGAAGALMTSAGTVKNFYVNEGATHKSGTSLTWTVYKNNVATALTCTVASGATTCNDVSHSFAAAAGDYLTVKSSTTASSSETLANVSVAMELWN